MSQMKINVYSCGLILITSLLVLKILHTLNYRMNIRPQMKPPTPFYRQYLSDLYDFQYTTSQQDLKFNPLSNHLSPTETAYRQQQDDFQTEDELIKFVTNNVLAVKDVTADNYFVQGEKELLAEGEIKDVRDIPSSKYSIISTDRTSYNQNEEIYVTVQLYNEFNQVVRRGGDDVRVWITGGQYKAAGEVYDLHNGTYKATIKAFWTGRTSIHASLAYTREEIRIMFKNRRKLKVLRYSVGRYFQHGNNTFMTLCSPFPSVPLYSRVCNLTKFNLNPYYCGQPKSPNVSCSDLLELHTINYSKQIMNTLEKKLLSKWDRVNRLKSSNITIYQGKRVDLAKCSSYNSSLTWTNTAPRGYFHSNKWHPSFCQGEVTSHRLSRCMRNLSIYLIGDSTVRQIFQSFLKLTKCTNVTWIGEPPHDRAHRYCDVPHSNFRVEYGIHGLPYSMVRTSDRLSQTKAIGLHLDELHWDPNKSKLVVMIHLYAHFLFFHTSVFEARVRSLKAPLRRLLSRYPKIKIFIKGPHAFTLSDFKPIVKSDYFGQVYRRILLRELFEFRDRVYYLDYWDMSVSSENKLLHPGETFVDEMVKLFLNLACNN